MMEFVEGLTGFGDLAVLLPLTAALLLWLGVAEGGRQAALWMLAAAVCAGGTAVLKVYFHACPPVPELRSPSGHTGFSTLVYGVLALVLAGRGQGWVKGLWLAAGIAFGIAIAVSRILLGAHTPLEAVLGLVIGGTTLALFARGRQRHPGPPPRRLWPLVAASVGLAAIFHGGKLNAEPFLQSLAWHLQARLPASACSGVSTDQLSR